MKLKSLRDLLSDYNKSDEESRNKFFDIVEASKKLQLKTQCKNISCFRCGAKNGYAT